MSKREKNEGVWILFIGTVYIIWYYYMKYNELHEIIIWNKIL